MIRFLLNLINIFIWNRMKYMYSQSTKSNQPDQYGGENIILCRRLGLAERIWFVFRTQTTYSTMNVCTKFNLNLTINTISIQ